MDRICVYPKDVCDITGKSLRYAQQVLQDLRFLLKKEKHQVITKKELATYLNMDPDEITLK